MYRAPKEEIWAVWSAKPPPASHCLTVFPPELTLSHSSFTSPLSPVLCVCPPIFLFFPPSYRPACFHSFLDFLSQNTSPFYLLPSLMNNSFFSQFFLTHSFPPNTSHPLIFLTFWLLNDAFIFSDLSFHLPTTFPSSSLLFSLFRLLSLIAFTLLPHPPSLPPLPFPSSISRLSLLPTSSALRSCSTGDSLLSSAFIRSAKSAPALAPPLPVLLHHHHPLLPPLADQLAGTHSLHYLSACLPAVCLETLHVRQTNFIPVVCVTLSSYLHIFGINSLHVVASRIIRHPSFLTHVQAH